MTESGFVKAQSDNLPKIDAFMMSTYYASNPDCTSAELKGVKAARYLFDMENNEKVFRSAIVICENRYKNNLYDLLKIVPAKPLVVNYKKKYTCDFIHKTGKIYVPKRRSKAKVKTVRDIRSSFENDTYAYLLSDLKSQQSYLLKKIRSGCSKNENTKKIAKKILRANAPISRPAWQMLTNINPEDHVCPRQFVLWNGKFIQVNGSYGGKNKTISSYDLANAKVPLNVKKAIKNNIPNKKKRLLQNSLNIKFKPGPLRRKKFLDDSHQKYYGDIELHDLPKVGLVVKPMYGTALEPTITHFLRDLRSEDGIISKKWAEFAVSVLGKNENSNARLLNSKCMTFDLKYKCDQRKIVMCKDFDNSCVAPTLINTRYITENITSIEHNIIPEIKDIMNKILDTVDININQDNMFTADESLQDVMMGDANATEVATFTKDKIKRKYCELDRLDVTVIQLPESSEIKTTQLCENAHCALGCLCDSLKGSYKFREHCGREECMFNCKCDISKYTSLNSLEVDGTHLLPGVINIEDEINMRLAKEEQKFHQTVIVTSEKNILFKSEKRNWKSSKKYETFYKNMCLKNVNGKEKRKRELSISLLKLNCENIEPWCMVHNLYKCFCKGTFTECTTPHAYQNLTADRTGEELCVDAECSLDKTEKFINNGPIKQLMRRHVRPNTNDMDNSIKITLLADKSNVNSNNIYKIDSGYACKNPERKRKTRTVADSINNQDIDLDTISEDSLPCTGKMYEHKCASDSSDSIDCYNSECNGTCSRVNVYKGRKYSDGYYKNTNNKIKEMEKNDKNLHIKMMSILNVNKEKEKEDTLVKNIEINPVKCPVTESKNLQMDKMSLLNKDSGKEKVDTIVKNTENIPAKCQLTEYKKPQIKMSILDMDLEKAKQNTLVKNIETIPTQCPVTVSSSNQNIATVVSDVNDTVITSSEGDKSQTTLLSKRNLPSDDKLVSWLESTYKMYKKRIDQGLLKSLLEPPKVGKIALHSWDFILSRYRDRKNLFLISKQMPYRIFMGVHTKNPFFSSCININEIRFADLHKYPQTVKNLLTNATDLKDDFCILRGLAHCWELVGSVTKVSNDENTEEANDEISDLGSNSQSNYSDVQLSSDEQSSFGFTEQINNETLFFKDCQNSVERSDEADSSKWFVMTVENDFSEIRFYKKGFFVKYESIVKAINVARMSGKTVRLSSQKCIDKNIGPQFGVYAIPNTNEYCVFIGPYEMQDSLGIETIKSILDVGKIKRTRGFWINTNKVDNLKVIDNPLSFMPLGSLQSNEAVPLDKHCEDNNLNNQNTSVHCHENVVKETLTKGQPKPEVTKTVKPIKIRKTNGFYHLATDGLMKKIKLQSPPKLISMGTKILNTTLTVGPNFMTKRNSLLETLSDNNISKDLDVEKGTQIKISAVYSQKDDPKPNNKKTEKGMLILKPEEINRKLFEGHIHPVATSLPQDEEHIGQSIANSSVTEYPLFQDDFENSATRVPCTLNTDVYVISDDEDDKAKVVATSDDSWKDVLIQCTNVPDLGWVWGRQKYNSHLLSFKVPGQQHSEFYGEEDAFKKLNDELSTIVGPSKPFDLEWRVVEEKIQGAVKLLDCEVLRKIFEEKEDQLALSYDPTVLASSNVKTYSKKNNASKSSPAPCVNKSNDQTDTPATVEEHLLWSDPK